MLYKAFNVFNFGFHREVGRLGFSLGLDGFQWIYGIKNGFHLGYWLIGFQMDHWILNKTKLLVIHSIGLLFR